MKEKCHIENIFNEMIDNVCYLKRATCIKNRGK